MKFRYANDAGGTDCCTEVLDVVLNGLVVSSDHSFTKQYDMLPPETYFLGWDQYVETEAIELTLGASPATDEILLRNNNPLNGPNIDAMTVSRQVCNAPLYG